MGENVRNAMFLAFGVFLFIAAVTLGFYLFQTVTASVDSTADAIAASDRTQQMQLQIPQEEHVVSGSVVLQSVRQIADVGVPITVDAVTYDPATFDIFKHSVSNISTYYDYRPHIVRNNDGSLQSIRYTRIY